jgi:hypothetical protein
MSAILNLSTIYSNMNADAPDFSWLPTADSSVLVDTQRIAAVINVLFFKVFCHSKSFQLWREFLIVLEFFQLSVKFSPVRAEANFQGVSSSHGSFRVSGIPTVYDFLFVHEIAQMLCFVRNYQCTKKVMMSLNTKPLINLEEVSGFRIQVCTYLPVDRREKRALCKGGSWSVQTNNV